MGYMKPQGIALCFLSLFILFSFAPAAAQNIGIPGMDDPYWQQQVDYLIKCDLDPESHMLAGTEVITYTNNSPDMLEKFYLHLYPDAYREKDSQLLKDYLAGIAFQVKGLSKKNRGWIDIDTLMVNGTGSEFSVEGTILTCLLSRPLPPGEQITIEFSFTEKIRQRIGRAGYIGDHYDMGQWYPKMVVYDKNGWHPDQFRMGEFYGEFGTFDVHITLPEEFVIAATGTPVSGDPGWDKNKPGTKTTRPEEYNRGKLKTVHFRADNVHDFAWSADPAFIVEDTEHNGYRIMSFYRPWNHAWADSALVRGVRAMKWLESFAGPYGYPQMSIVDANAQGGMEYPMLVMNGSAGQNIILHEIGHNWFYGMLANNERDEAWMDEGMTQYQMFLYNEQLHGPYGKPYKKTFSSWLNPPKKLWEGLAGPVIDYHRSGFAERVATPHHEFKSSGRSMVYVKSALFIRALRYYVGDEDFRKIIHTYFERWKFKHVDEEAFLSVCEEISGMDLGEFFRQWLHTTKDCDYSIARFGVEESEGGYTADVMIKRKGEMIIPLKLAFRLKNGNTVSERIDGMPRDFEKIFTFPVEPVSLSINPDNEILDIYHLDNFSPRRRAFIVDNPFNRFYPTDAYQYRILPLCYYNDIDGGKAGLRVRGSYGNTYRKFTLQGMYGIESEAFDVYGSYESPLKYFGREAAFYTDAWYREGRQGGTLAISKTMRKYLTTPAAKHYTLKFTYQELTDSSYVFPNTYDEGKNLKASFLIASYPRADIFETSILLGLERSTWGSDHNYEKLTFDFRLWASSGWPLPIKPGVRLFFGRSTIDPPLQEMFNLAGAGSLDKENYFWLRSRGAFWKDQYNNFHVSGDGNLRGYYNADFSFKSLFASNIEIEVPLPIPPGRKGGGKMIPKIFLFYDWGKVLDSSPLHLVPEPLSSELDSDIFDDILQDFGIGVRVWKLTANFPLYISHPSLTGDEEKWEYRWTIGFNSLF